VTKDHGRRAAGGARRERFLALGDSYTIGEGVADAERWPMQLAAKLWRRGVPLAPPEIVARSGWTCAQLESGIADARPAGPFGLVSLLIGVNDQYRGDPAALYARRFQRLLRRAKTLAGGRAWRVIVLSIPDWSVTPFAEGRDRAAIAAAIAAYNAANRAAAAAAGARYVNVTPESRRASRDRTLLAADQLHPAGAMYARWARLVLPEALAALAEDQRSRRRKT
jgi:lysophospholipase L1-like esterase